MRLTNFLCRPYNQMPPWRNRLARSAVNRKVGGSSPPGGGIFLQIFPRKVEKILTLAGLEPAIPWFVVRCLIRWATGPDRKKGHNLPNWLGQLPQPAWQCGQLRSWQAVPWSRGPRSEVEIPKSLKTFCHKCDRRKIFRPTWGSNPRPWD